ncbi:MAG TPA: DUF4136 domain-containing protein [Flavitalea sp.]|nr:DUF4136 domain-containing protein [Flavitalea sp.]
MRFSYLFLVIAITLFSGCSGPKVVSTQASPGADMSKYKTYDFYKMSASGDTIPGKFAERSELLKEAISTQLNSKGLTRVTEKPDLLVNIGIVVKEEVQTRTTDIRDAPRYMGQRNYHWESEEKIVDIYRVGTATVEMVDAATNALVWKSVVEDVIPDKDSKVPATIHEGMAEMFSKFPGK